MRNKIKTAFGIQYQKQFQFIETGFANGGIQ